MATRLITVVTYHKDLPAINSHDPSMRWLCEVTRQIKYIISPTAEDPWTPEAAVLKDTRPFDHVSNMRLRAT